MATHRESKVRIGQAIGSASGVNLAGDILYPKVVRFVWENLSSRKATARVSGRIGDGFLADRILARAAQLTEGTPVSTGTFLDMGTRPAIRNALERLFRTQQLLRVGRGIYVVPVVSRFGSSAPAPHRLVEQLSRQSGEDIVPSGATTANALGLTTQVPVRMVYWTSGRSRKLNLGKLIVHLEHVASWQLALAKEPAGEIVRALAWAGPERVHIVLKEIERKVPRTDMVKVAQQVSRLPK